MTTARPYLRRFVAAAVLAGTVLTASGCSGGGLGAGAAAIVGDRRLTVSDVQTATTELNMVGGGQRINQRDVLAFLIAEPYFVQTASDKGVGVSTDDAKRYLVTQVGWKNTTTGSTEPSASTVDFVRCFLARRALTPQQDGSGPTEEEAVATFTDISRRMRADRIEVNPRYGSFQAVFDNKNRDYFQVLPENPDWFVAPSGQPQPTPSQ